MSLLREFSPEFAANPLINPPDLPLGVPALDRIKEEHFLPAVRWGIELAQQRIAAIRDNPEPPTFENTIEALEFAGEELERIQSVLSNISRVNNSNALDAVEKETGPELARFSSSIYFDGKLFDRVRDVFDARNQLVLTDEQLMLLGNTYKKFKGNGVHLPFEQKERLRLIEEKLSLLKKQFGNNLVNAASSYKRIVANEAELDGVPDRAKNSYRAAAREEKLGEGVFLISLARLPYDILAYCRNRVLREDIYRTYSGKCYHDEFDNTVVIRDIVQLRHERAQLLGEATHADLTISDLMAGSKKRVEDFLENSLGLYKPAAEAELQELRDFANHMDGLSDVQPWDVDYYSRLLKEQKFDFESEKLRPYFDLEKVLEGLFEHAETLFNIEVREENSGKYPVYHPDVKTFEVHDKASGNLIAIFYGDYYERIKGKSDGAWCNAFRDKGLFRGVDHIPLVTQNCNFPKPTPEQPTLLSFGQVRALFHEFGHVLHAMLSVIHYPSLSAFNAKWDFVELPSQLMENWIDQVPVLERFARHYQTSETLPPELIEKMKDGRNFQCGLQGLRMTYFSLLDLAFYGNDPAKMGSIEDIEAGVAVRAKVLKADSTISSVIFRHIFAGSYSARYYSYMWAAVMEADVFEQFEKVGIYDKSFATKLRETIFASAGAVDPMKLYVQLMGRGPDPDAVHRREGVLPALSTMPSPGLLAVHTCQM